MLSFPRDRGYKQPADQPGKSILPFLQINPNEMSSDLRILTLSALT